MEPGAPQFYEACVEGLPDRCVVPCLPIFFPPAARCHASSPRPVAGSSKTCAQRGQHHPSPSLKSLFGVTFSRGLSRGRCGCSRLHQAVYNWVTSELYGILKAAGSTSADMPITPSQLRELVELVDTAVLSGLLAKKVLAVMVAGDPRGPRAIADEMGLVQISDTGELELMCQQVDESLGLLELAVLRCGLHQPPSLTLCGPLLTDPPRRTHFGSPDLNPGGGMAFNPTHKKPQVLEEFPSQTAEYVEKRDPKLIKFFIGQAMRKSRGKANPKVVQPLMKKLLDNH